METRTHQRNTFAPDVRIALAEADLDYFDGIAKDLADEIKRLRLSITAFFVALATSSVLLAINLLVKV
jgi:hypothetical protein